GGAFRAVRDGPERPDHRGSGHQPVEGVRIRGDGLRRRGAGGHPGSQRLRSRRPEPDSQRGQATGGPRRRPGWLRRRGGGGRGGGRGGGGGGGYGGGGGRY